MKRRTLDYIFSTGAAVLGLLLIVLGLVLADQAAFAQDYVRDQLSQQKITFPAAEELTEEEKGWKPGSSCLEDHAGQLMTKGTQAECYANFFIAMHMDRSARNAGFEGETYATMGAIRTQLQGQVTDAKADGDTAAADAAQQQLDAATSLRGTFQTGETLRGLLLTSYGFSIFGERAALAGTVCFIAGGLLILLSIAGFIHAIRTPDSRLV